MIIQATKKVIIITVISLISFGCFPNKCPVCIKDNKQYGWPGGNFLGQWDDYYACGQSYMEGQCFDKAIWAFNEAKKLREKDQWMARSYGMHFVDYFPHRESGICFFETAMFHDALHELETSVSQEQSDKAFYYIDQVRKKNDGTARTNCANS